MTEQARAEQEFEKSYGNTCPPNRRLVCLDAYLAGRRDMREAAAQYLDEAAKAGTYGMFAVQTLREVAAAIRSLE